MTPASLTAPVESITVDAQLLPDHAACATVVQAPPTPEQVAAAEAVFSQQKDGDMAYGLLGIWTSTVLLHDLMLDHFWTTGESEEEQLKRRKGRREESLPDGLTG